MDFTILTLFPELTDAFFSHGMISKGIEKQKISARSINIREFAQDRHNTVDDRPYGGGSGMVMKPDILTAAIKSAKQNKMNAKVLLMSPQGKKFNQQMASRMAGEQKDLILVCGRYEGIDERVYTEQVDDEISTGDYVLTGGELAAMTIIDAVARLIPGVLGSLESSQSDSFTGDRLEHAQYTRPEIFDGRKVPDVLLSGNHQQIELWRKRSALQRTFLKRPDLFEKTLPDAAEKEILSQWCRELENIVNS